MLRVSLRCVFVFGVISFGLLFFDHVFSSAQDNAVKEVTPKSAAVKGAQMKVAIFNAGSGGFMLQRYYQQVWAENSMLQQMVDDLAAGWEHIESLKLAATFGVQSPKPPALQPWGLCVAYLYDPAGVLWHVAQRRDGAIQD